MSNPFSLEDHSAYRAWRQAKLDAYPRTVTELMVEVRDLGALDRDERTRIADCIRRANMVLLQCTNKTYLNKVSMLRLGAQLGLKRLDTNLCADEDGVSTLTVGDQRRAHDYIPYTDRALSWHTDGYYNGAEAQIRAWSLCCEQDASEGGDNALLDHEILYILLRDENPDFVRALTASDAMTIPANKEGGEEIRPARTGPVFSPDPRTGALHMRYSARARNIEWQSSETTQAALRFIDTLFSSHPTYIFRVRLSPGQCLVSNNVLHNRSAFRDTPTHRRVIYRARYYDRIEVGGLGGSAESSATRSPGNRQSTPRKAHAEAE